MAAEPVDFLAEKLIENGWRLKAMHRLIMTSATYKQSSAFQEEAARKDGDSRLLWRFPPRRLSAEEVRDTVLVVSGKLEAGGWKRVGGGGSVERDVSGGSLSLDPRHPRLDPRRKSRMSFF